MDDSIKILCLIVGMSICEENRAAVFESIPHKVVQQNNQLITQANIYWSRWTPEERIACVMKFTVDEQLSVLPERSVGASSFINPILRAQWFEQKRKAFAAHPHLNKNLKYLVDSLAI